MGYRRSVKFVAVLLAIIMVGTALPAAVAGKPHVYAAGDSYEGEYRLRAQQLIDHVAARSSYTWFSDHQKYLWPGVLAKLSKDMTNQQALDWVRTGNYGTSKDAVNWGKVNLLFRDEFFHFAGIGLVRIMLQYPHVFNIPYEETGKTMRRDVLEKSLQDRWLKDIPNGGTENHLVMMFTTDYLLMQEAVKEQLPGAAERLDAAKQWIRKYAAALYANGQGEWDSSNYLAFDMIGFLNLFDFADDSDIKEYAKAVLDWYAASYALKYTNGVYGGAEMRGAAALSSGASITDVFGYIWFGDAPLPPFTGNTPLYAVHAALSDYRPHPAIVTIARKAFDNPSMSFNSKPDYWMNQRSESRETFYMTKQYSLGASYTPYGGWGGGTFRVYPWRLTAKGSGGAQVLMGNAISQSTGGNGRNPFTQLAHYENVLIQMTVVPEQHAAIVQEVKDIYDAWRAREKALRTQACADGKSPNFCITSDPVGFTNYNYGVPEGFLNFPASTYVQPLEGSDAVFFRMNETYVATFPIHGKATTPANVSGGRAFVKDVGVVGRPAGFVIEVGEADQFESFADFQSQIVSRTKLDKSELDQLIIRYTNLAGTTMTMKFQTSGSYTEPQFDWGVVPQFPSGEGGGRVADVWINDRKLLLNRAWEVYDSPYVQVKGSTLRVSDGKTGFRTFINPAGKVITTPNPGAGQVKSWSESAYFSK